MRNSNRMTAPIRSIIYSFSIICLLSFSAAADELKIDVAQEGAVKQALQALIGKTATLNTDGGEPVTGTVDSVGTDAVKITQLSGKEFYSAVVRLNSIVSVIYRGK